MSIHNISVPVLKITYLCQGDKSGAIYLKLTAHKKNVRKREVNDAF